MNSPLHKKTQDNIKQDYLSDSRPWVVAFSGGKDSTLLLQLIYEMLLELKDKAHKPVFVVSSDTCVEPPNIISYLEEALNQIQKKAEEDRLPLKVQTVRPNPEESFWGNVIGKGYPSPTRWFRWCTSHMKIHPTRRFINELVRTYGSVVILLGNRVSESSHRGQRMDKRELNERGLNPHHEIPDALVSTPIAQWSTDQVWEYLFTHNPPPWGGSHDFMLNLYRQASGGECPIVLDMNTPSCGGTRFGCWTCTVVKEDKSMQGFIETGQAWMKPLNEFRNWLKEIRENPEYRMPRRRNGSKGPGPFTYEVRKKILEKLLETEQRVGKRLVSDEEIVYIQQIWNNEFDFGKSAYELLVKYGREIKEMAQKPLPPEDQRIMDSLVGEYELNPELVAHLLYLVTQKYPSFDPWGSKVALEREIAEAIEKAIKQEEQAVSE